MSPRFFSLSAVVLAWTAGTLPVSAQSWPPPSISVTGEATVSAPPDLAVIDAGVTSEAKTARDASDANNAAMGKVLLALKSMGLDDKDYQTSRLSLQPQYASNRTGPNAITGYRATNRVSIKLRDVAKVANLIDTVTGAGANDIGGIDFTVASPSKLLDDARTKAFEDARRKAEIYARAGNVVLGTPLSITEGGAPPAFPFRRMAATAAAPAPIAQGEETLHVSVGVSWSIRPAAPPERPPPVPPAPIPSPPATIPSSPGPSPDAPIAPKAE